MKLPFWAEVPDPKPRKYPGRNPNLDPVQMEVLDAIDVMEQKMDFAITMSVRAHNLCVILSILLLLIQGPAVLAVVQKWLGGVPAATSKTIATQSYDELSASPK